MRHLGVLFKALKGPMGALSSAPRGLVLSALVRFSGVSLRPMPLMVDDPFKGLIKSLKDFHSALKGLSKFSGGPY